MEIDEIERSIDKELEACTNIQDLETIRIKYLGRKGELTLHLRGIKNLPADERPGAGAQVNRLKERLETLLSEKEALWIARPLGRSWAEESTIPPFLHTMDPADAGTYSLRSSGE
jgi:phenylalanyl-tRNA synthetase alpha chain